MQPIEEDKEVEQEDDEDEDEEYDSGGSGVALTPPERPGLTHDAFVKFLFQV